MPRIPRRTSRNQQQHEARQRLADTTAISNFPDSVSWEQLCQTRDRLIQIREAQRARTQELNQQVASGPHRTGNGNTNVNLDPSQRGQHDGYGQSGYLPVSNGITFGHRQNDVQSAIRDINNDLDQLQAGYFQPGRLYGPQSTEQTIRNDQPNHQERRPRSAVAPVHSFSVDDIQSGLNAIDDEDPNDNWIRNRNCVLRIDANIKLLYKITQQYLSEDSLEDQFFDRLDNT